MAASRPNNFIDTAINWGKKLLLNINGTVSGDAASGKIAKAFFCE
jgi:hypothetical protein